MNIALILFGLAGFAYCAYKVYLAWQGKAGIPFGAIIGGGIGAARHTARAKTPSSPTRRASGVSSIDECSF